MSSSSMSSSSSPIDTIAQLPFVTPLTQAQLDSAGVPKGWGFGMADRVRFHELDPLNHVNNVAYFSWFETLRIYYLKHAGVSLYRESDPQVVVGSNFARYFKPMHLGDSYVICARTKSYRNSSFVQEYGVFVNGNLMSGGECLVVTLERDGVTKRALSTDVIEFFKNEGATGPQ